MTNKAKKTVLCNLVNIKRVNHRDLDVILHLKNLKSLKTNSVISLITALLNQIKKNKRIKYLWYHRKWYE